MELADLNTLLIVAREQSFSRAARLLNRTQPAVSLAVRRLEERAGVVLFTRETRRPELTEAGRLLVTYAQQMCGVQDDAKRALVRLRELRTGIVTIGVDDSWCGAVMPLVCRFRDAHAAIRVSLRAVPSRPALDILGRGELDLAVVERAPDAVAYEATAIARDHLVLVVASDHPLGGRASVSLCDLHRETIVAISGDPTSGAAGPAPSELMGASRWPELLLPSLDAVKRAVASGLGVSVLPSTAVAGEVATGTLVAVPWRDDTVRDRPRQRTLWLVRSRESSPTMAAAEFFELATACGVAHSDALAPVSRRGRPRVA